MNYFCIIRDPSKSNYHRVSRREYGWAHEIIFINVGGPLGVSYANDGP